MPDRHPNAEFDQTGVDFLIADLDTALTFMDLASTSAVEETVQRNHENARKAYETILHLFEKLALDETRGRMIRSKLALLKERLQAAGYEV